MSKKHILFKIFLTLLAISTLFSCDPPDQLQLAMQERTVEHVGGQNGPVSTIR